MITLEKTEAIQKLTDLIMVKRPYNKLLDIDINSDHSLSATVTNEFSCVDQGGPLII